MGLSIQLSAAEGSHAPLLPFPIDSLWICTSVGANSISITNWFSSLKQKKINKKAQISPEFVIWTGSLDFTYYLHYSQHKEMAQHHTARSRRERKSKMSVSWELYIVVSAQRNHSSRLLLLLCCGISTCLCPFSHLPSLGISQNSPISTKEKNLDEFHKEGQGSYFYSNALGFFPRESSLQSTRA